MPGRAIIGRTADNDLQIRSKFVSRHHAQIITTRENCVVEDLNSTNGIFVRSQRVKHHELSEGDIVQLGEHELLYHDLRGRGGEEARKRDEELDDDDLLDEEDDDESE
jgi:pSer/pThr/pTyr-binding forkhead associated (FHA) protein